MCLYWLPRLVRGLSALPGPRAAPATATCREVCNQHRIAFNCAWALRPLLLGGLAACHFHCLAPCSKADQESTYRAGALLPLPSLPHWPRLRHYPTACCRRRSTSSASTSPASSSSSSSPSPTTPTPGSTSARVRCMHATLGTSFWCGWWERMYTPKWQKCKATFLASNK